MFIIEKSYSSASISRNIRFDEKIFEDLKQAMHQHDVSFNSLVLQCCRYALEHLQDEEITEQEPV